MLGAARVDPGKDLRVTLRIRSNFASQRGKGAAAAGIGRVEKGCVAVFI